MEIETQDIDHQGMDQALALPFSDMKPTPRPKLSLGKDEMNLVEFPLTVLSTRSNPNIKTLEFSDTIYDKNAKPIVRKWIITGADKFGLPTSSDDEVLLGLLKLTYDRGFQDRKIYFTRYELLKILRWTTEGRSYTRLQNALDRLSGVRVKATNAFFDNEIKAHSTRNFGVLDGYEINDGRDNARKKSFFTWSEVLFKSFQVGFIKTLDLDFYLELTSAVSRRLYRYLDKRSWYKTKIQINLFTLAHEKIGISRNYKYPSSIRQQIDPAVEELISSGFLSHYEYVGTGKATDIIFYAASKKPRVSGSSGPKRELRTSKSTEASQQTSSKLGAQRGAKKGVGELAGSDSIFENTVQLLQDRGIAVPQAKRLLSEKSDQELKRISKIVEQFDYRMNSSSLKNPTGWLYRSVERSESFVLPGESAQGQLDLGTNPGRRTSYKPAVSPKKGAEDQDAKYLVWYNQQYAKARKEIEPGLLAKITEEVEASLHNIRNSLKKEHFERMVQIGVEKKICKTFAIPEFEDWLAEQR